MKYKDFEDAFSTERTNRYIVACNGNKCKAMTLYRYNLRLSQEMFTLVSCFEVTLRNRIDRQMTAHFGGDWLRDLVLPGGQFFNNYSVEKPRKLLQMPITNSKATAITVTPSFCQPWSSVFGSIFIPMPIID